MTHTCVSKVDHHWLNITENISESLSRVNVLTENMSKVCLGLNVLSCFCSTNSLSDHQYIV